MVLKQDDLVLCTVKSIEGTTVFLEIEGGGSGAIVLSEIAAGRIRNIREYVAPNKKVVCKVLKVQDGHAQLTLRRVTTKERDEVLERYQKERTFTSILKQVTSDPAPIIAKIKEEYEIPDFMEKARETPKIIEAYFNKSDSATLAKMLAEKGEKEKISKKVISLKSNTPSGLYDIQSILDISGLEIHYLGSSKFSLIAKGKDFKEANGKILAAIEKIKSSAKEKKLDFEEAK